MVMVSPSILSADFVNLERDLRAIARSGADYIHVDVMDGLFVPNLTIGMPVVQAIARVSQLPLDVHLMIDRPIRYVDGFCQAGASILAVHLESDTLRAFTGSSGAHPGTGGPASPGLKARHPGRGRPPSPGAVRHDPGDDGGARLQRSSLHGRYGCPSSRPFTIGSGSAASSCILEVDGGVGPATFQTCLDHGADLLVAGSAYFRAPTGMPL